MFFAKKGGFACIFSVYELHMKCTLNMHEIYELVEKNADGLLGSVASPDLRYARFGGKNRPRE
jgi:hypothetical protein